MTIKKYLPFMFGVPEGFKGFGIYWIGVGLAIAFAPDGWGYYVLEDKEDGTLYPLGFVLQSAQGFRIVALHVPFFVFAVIWERNK